LPLFTYFDIRMKMKIIFLKNIKQPKLYLFILLFFLFIYLLLTLNYGDVLYCTPNDNYPESFYFSVAPVANEATESVFFTPEHVNNVANQSVYVGPPSPNFISNESVRDVQTHGTSCVGHDESTRLPST